MNDGTPAPTDNQGAAPPAAPPAPAPAAGTPPAKPAAAPKAGSPPTNAPPAKPAAPARPPQKPATNLLEAGADPAAEPIVQANWPDDWREKIAKGDDKIAKRLSRFTSPEAMWNSYAALEGRFSSGEFKPMLPKDASPEEVIQWRKENGIPDAPDGYLEKLPDGVVIGEDDKELVKLFAKDMHDRNASPEIVHAAIASYYKVQEVVNAELAEQDQAAARECEDALRAELGGQYRGMVNGLENYLATLPTELADNLRHARLTNGKQLFGDIESIKWFNAIVREMNPVSTVVPGSGAQAGVNLETEIKNIEAMMGDRKSDYWKGPKAPGLQARYRELVDARDRQNARAR